MKTSLLPGAFFLATLGLPLHADDDTTPETPPAEQKPAAIPKKIDFDELRRETGIAAIVVAPHAAMEANYRREAVDWAKRIIVQPAKERFKGQAWEADAAAFLDSAAAWWWGESHALPPKYLANQATQLWNTNCRDAAVLYLAGQAITKTHYPQAADDYFSEGLKSADESGGLAAIGLLHAWVELSRLDGERNVQLERDFLRYFEAALKDGSFAEKDTPILVRTWYANMDTGLLGRQATALTGIIEHSKLPPWARLAMLGPIEVQLAWKARGHGFANTVTPEGWKGFKSHLETAGSHLKESWKLEPARPEAATEMLDVVLGLGEEGEDTLGKWFERATAAQFDYDPAYHAMLNCLLPRWHGSYAHLLAFGESCLATKRFDTLVPGYFLRSLETISNEIPDWRPLYRQPDVASRVLGYLNANIAEPTRAPQREEWEASRAAYAWICGDYPLAAKLMPNATFSKEGWGSQALRRLGVDLTQAFNESLLRGGPAQSDFEAGMALRESKRWDDARLAYNAAREKSKGRTSYIDGELCQVDFEQAVEGGEWTKLPTGKGEAGWAHLSGNWTTDNSRIVCTGYNSSAELVFGGRAPGDFELRGHFAFSGPQDAARSFCVLFGHSPLPCVPHLAHWWTAQCWSQGGKGMAVVENDFYAPRKDGKKEMEIPTEADFHLTKHGDVVDFTINDQQVFTDYKLSPASDRSAGEGPYIGVGASMLEYNTTLEITNLEVRKLGRKL